MSNEQESASPASFKFGLGEQVELESGEAGRVIGQARYLNNENSYYLRYTAADGRLTESWWNESATING